MPCDACTHITADDRKLMTRLGILMSHIESLLGQNEPRATCDQEILDTSGGGSHSRRSKGAG